MKKVEALNKKARATNTSSGTANRRSQPQNKRQNAEPRTILAPVDFSTDSLRALDFGLPAVMIVYGALGLEWLFAARWANPLVGIGDASYSIYLMHLFPINALTGSSAEMPMVRFIAAVAIGLAVHRLLERPLGDWVARRRRSRQPETVGPEAPGLASQG